MVDARRRRLSTRDTQGTVDDCRYDHVIFYRNMNFGHPGSPTRHMLEVSLLQAGAELATSFQTNGTVLLSATAPELVLRRSAEILANSAAYRDLAVVCSIDTVRRAIEAPQALTEDPTVYRMVATFWLSDPQLELALPWTNSRGNVSIELIDAEFAVSVSRKFGSVVGSPNAEIEKLTGQKATTRTIGTLERLLRAAYKK